MEKMRLIAAESAVIWHQAQSLMVAKVTGNYVHPYYFPSYQRNIRRLEEAIDGAITVGLFEDLIGTDDDEIVLHLAFIQTLAHMETLDPERADLEDWTLQHFMMGMVRLQLRCCELHVHSMPEVLRRWIERLSMQHIKFQGDALPKNMRDLLEKNASPHRAEAWNYHRSTAWQS